MAYTRVIPRTTAESGVYLVYDVAQDHATNRMEPAREDMTRLQNAGTAVFPSWNVTNRSYSGGPAEVLFTHDRHSPIKWVDTQRFVFLDYEGPASLDHGPSRLTAVLVDMADGSRSPFITTRDVDAGGLIDTKSFANPRTNPGSHVFAKAIDVVEVLPTSCRVRFVLTEGAGTKVADFEVEF